MKRGGQQAVDGAPLGHEGRDGDHQLLAANRPEVADIADMSLQPPPAIG